MMTEPNPRQHANSLRRYCCLAALLIWLSILTFLSLASDVKAPPGLFDWDKFNHFAAYAFLALLLNLTLTAWSIATTRLLTVSWIVSAAYGLLLEGLQWSMGLGRQWELGDLLANALGALTACVLFRHTVGRFLKANEP